MAATKKTTTRKSSTKTTAKKTTAKKTTAPKATEMKSTPTKTVTVNGRKVKVTEKRSSRFNSKGERVQKKCSVCGKWQSLDLYYRPARDCRCKECSGKYAKDLRDQKAAAEKKSKRGGNSKSAA